MRVRVLSVVVLLVASASLLSGCAGQSAVQNQTNQFQYAGQVAGNDGAETYTWRNTMGGAQFQWGGQASAGTLVVTVRDAGGTTVFTKTLSGAQQDAAQERFSGRPGDWTVELAFHGFTGQMGLQLNAQPVGFS